MATASDQVAYQPYNPELPAVFEAIKALIRSELPDIPVEHVGSTSIPGVGGRNVLDVVIAAAASQQPAIRQRLYALGFGDSSFRHFLPVLTGSLTAHGHDYPILLYVVEPDSEIYRGWLAFRDYLRAHPEAAQTYDGLKRQVAGHGAIDGQQYQQAKTPFLTALRAKIERPAG